MKKAARRILTALQQAFSFPRPPALFIQNTALNRRLGVRKEHGHSCAPGSSSPLPACQWGPGRFGSRQVGPVLQSHDGCDSRAGKQRRLYLNSLWATTCTWEQDMCPHVTPQGSNLSLQPTRSAASQTPKAAHRSTKLPPEPHPPSHRHTRCPAAFAVGRRTPAET